MVPQPFLGVEAVVGVEPFSGGSRYVWTWPEASPTATTGAEGWMAWAKRSEVKGRVQIVSNIGSRKV